MRKIAVFGGTFNPVHNGHLHLAKNFYNIIHADELLFIPTYIPPHKAPVELAAARDRLEMCRLAVKGTPFGVSDMEVKRGGPSYTSDTLTALKKIYGRNSSLYLIVGEDMFLTVDRWHKPEVIYSLATLCAAPRGKGGCGKLTDYAVKLRRKGADVLIADIDYLPVSSTSVRSAVKKKENLSAYVPESVACYILKKHLYSE
ncbi:MAG TPA: nicotinate (nicotinamide) nucleotide adenylyltransferase [Ruminococcaceae bacterium]|nr:nicotinate (nicotinamide) nucleotide adenylyltransferase [Oscillospiraceae bacterium]